MIRRLSEKDRSQVLRLLRRDSSYNLYMISNVEQLGFETDYCIFWGDFAKDSDTGLRGLVNRYMLGWSVFGLQGACWSALAQVIDSDSVIASRLQDNPGGVESLLPYLATYETERVVGEEMMVLDAADFRMRSVPEGFEIRRAILADLDALVEFYAEAGLMARSRAAVVRPLRDLRVWIALKRGTLCAAALTNAETEQTAMIGGVLTASAYRGQGLSQAVCSALCCDLLREGKQPVLYWESPAAGAVYRNLGFRAIGTWRSVWLRRKEESET